MPKPDDEDVTKLQQITLGLVEDLNLKLPLLQMTMFLICYLDERNYTVRDMAEHLDRRYVEVMRAVTRLVELDLVACDLKPFSRSLIEKSKHGAELMAEFRSTIGRALVKAADTSPRTGRRLPASPGKSGSAAEGGVDGRG
jgi:hypothetical protein